MEYKATAPRKLLFVFAFLIWTTGLIPFGRDLTSWFSLILFIFILISLTITYTFTITQANVSYDMQIFGLSIYKKQVSPQGMKKVVFKRVGWASKLAVIKTEKGFPIRVAFFAPDDVFEELIEFCNRNKVDHMKTKDYQILEKRPVSPGV